METITHQEQDGGEHGDHGNQHGGWGQQQNGQQHDLNEQHVQQCVGQGHLCGWFDGYVGQGQLRSQPRG